MKISKDILRLAVPSILANITIPLVGMVDTAIVGHISDSAAIGGIAIGTMLFDLLYWNFGFLRVGTSGLTAQAYGAQDHDQCARILGQSLDISLVAAVVLWAIQWLFVTIALACVPCSADVADFARQYFYIRIWAAPATLALMAFKGWFIGMQDTVSAMVTDIVVNVVNIVASFGLAVYTPLGMMGVAYGTLIAQYTGLAIAVVIVVMRYGRYLRCLADWEQIRQFMRWKSMQRMMTLNGNLVIRSLCFLVVYVGFTSIASKYGNEQLAVASIIMKLFMLFSYFVDGFAYAGEALVGKFIGEHNAQELKHAVRVLFNWSIGVGLLFTAIYWIGGQTFIDWMTTDETVRQLATDFIPWLIAMPLLSTLAFMWDGVYVGATAGVEIRNAMIWSAVGFVLAYVALYRCWGIQALYVAYFVHLLARVVYLSLNWKKVYL